MLFCFVLIRVDPWFVIWDDLINAFWSTAIVFSNIFLQQSTRTFFCAIVKLCGIQREEIFFTPRCSCKIEYMLVKEMPKDGSISRYVTWRSGIINSRTASMFFGKTAVFGRPLRTLSLCKRRPQFNSLNQFSTVLRMVLYRQTNILVHECTLVVIIHVARKCSRVHAIFRQTNFFKSL